MPSFTKNDRAFFLKNANSKNLKEYFKILNRMTQNGGKKYKEMLEEDIILVCDDCSAKKKGKNKK
tara:strand:- start:263 stop:457 length:195 start_codon:yes stop_codon:yes gene_type:complete